MEEIAKGLPITKEAVRKSIAVEESPIFSTAEEPAICKSAE